MTNEQSIPRLIENRFLKLPPMRRIEKGDRREWVYFIQAEAAPGLIKIGHATNLKWRLAGIQTQCPVQLKLVGAVNAPAGAEFCFHHIFKAERQHGEWFIPSAKLKKEISLLPKAGHIFDRDLRTIAERHGESSIWVEELLGRVSRHKRCENRQAPDGTCHDDLKDLWHL